MCCGQKGGYTRRRRRGEEGGERGQCTWSQPPSFPSPLPGSPQLHRTPWLPSPPHPCAQPLQKQPPLALRTPRLSLLEVARMLLARLARLPLYPLKLLPAAMTAPRTAGRDVRVRERRRRHNAVGWGRAGGPGGLGAGALGADLLAEPRMRAGTQESALLKYHQVWPWPDKERSFLPGASCSPASHPPTWEGALASDELVILTLLLLLEGLRAEGTRPTLPRCFLALGGHLRDRYKLERWQRWSQRGCCPCLRGADPSPTTAVSCCPPAAFGGLGKRFPLGCLSSCYHLKGGGQGIVSTRNGKDSLLCSCHPTKPPPHSKEGRIPETAAPNCVEAGLILPGDL